MTDVQQWIKNCEGLNLDMYTDTTGNKTIGWGHNLSNGITPAMAEFIFQADYALVVSQLQEYSWYLTQPENVKNALINMTFNLGIHKLLEFTKMITALINKDYTTAAQEALNSAWATEVGLRAKDVALMIRQE